jgi:hypothetical protein
MVVTPMSNASNTARLCSISAWIVALVEIIVVGHAAGSGARL